MYLLNFTILLIICFVTTRECRIVSSLPEFDNRILNGKRAQDNQFPYQVSLQRKGRHTCGGSIISEVKVLTAAHCVVDKDGRLLPKEIFLILAGTNYLNNGDPVNRFYVKQISKHPKYNPATVQNDYAIVFIKSKFNFKSKNILTVPLAIKEPVPGTVCYLSGWGNVDKGQNTKIPNELQFATITIDESRVCETMFYGVFMVGQMLCAGERNDANAGVGDSGGPIVCNSYLAGVVSFGGRIYNSHLPDVYSSVSYVFDWINSTDPTNGSKKHKVVDWALIEVLLIIYVLVTQIICH